MMWLRNIALGNIAARFECRLPGAVLLRQVDENGDGGCLRSADRRSAHGRNFPLPNARPAGVKLVGAGPAAQPNAGRDSNGCPRVGITASMRW